MFQRPKPVVELTIPVRSVSETSNPIITDEETPAASPPPQEAVEIKERSTMTYTCLREFIVANHHLYVFCAITGMLTPDTNDNQKNTLTKHNFRYRFWFLYLHLFYFLSICYFMIYGIITMILSPNYDLLLFCEYFGVAQQLFIIIPVVMYLRSEMIAKRELDEVLYLEAFSHAVKLSWRVFIVLIILSLLFFITEVAVTNYYSPAVKFLIFVLYMLLLTPTSFFLTGIMAFLIVEQRISFRTMERIQARAKEELLTHEEYFEARESIDARDRLTPLNIMTASAILNCIFCVIVIVALKNRHMTNKGDVVFAIVYILSNFGKQPVVVGRVLREVVKVNEIAEKIIEFISRYRWFTNDTSDANRVSLYIATKEYPIGSTIFFVRPTKFQVRIQIASVIIGIGTAVFWALIFA